MTSADTDLPAAPNLIRRSAWGLLVGVPILLLVLGTLDGLREVTDIGLPVVPWQTLWSLPLDRWIRDIAATLTLGFLIVGGLLLGRPIPRLLRAASLSAVVWLASLLAMVPLTVSEILGRPLGDSLDPTIVSSLMLTDLGRVLGVQIMLVTLVAVLGWAVLGRATAIIVLVLAAIPAALPALTGHSGLGGGHTSATISLAFHLLALGVWVGGLIATCRYLLTNPPDAAMAVRRFSTLALVAVIVLAESGLLNASLRMDGFSSLITSPYGSLVLAKAVVLAALVVLGWRQRRLAVPLSGEASGQELVLRLAAFEILLMGVAIGLSTALSRTAPPAGAIAGDRITAAALGLLALAIPLVIVWAGGRPKRLVRITSGFPEPFAVLVVVTAVVLAAVVPSGLLGIGFAAILASALLVGVGWLFALAAIGPRGVPAVVMAMVLWPVALWWSQRSESTETVWQVALAVLLAEICLVLLLVVRRRGMKSRSAALSETEPESVNLAGQSV